MATPALPQLIESFDELQRRVESYDVALNIIEYDSQTVAPAAGAAAHGEAQATLFAAMHDLQCSPETGELLAQLNERKAELDPLHAAELRVFTRTYEQDSRVPAQVAADYKRLTTESFHVWRQARENNDFAGFEPYLDRIFDSLREQAHYIAPEKDPYDVWLDRWEPGCSREVCDGFFDTVGKTVTPLVHAIVEQGIPTYEFAHQSVPVPVQQAIAYDTAQAIGLDMSRLTFGLTAHPFTTCFDRNDVRIAHHYYENNVLECLATTIHEGGHSLYEQNVDPKYSFTCLKGGASAGMHESQSRLMENMVGRSRPFMEVLLPILRKHVPEIYNGVDADQLYRASNLVHPSLIRTQADELTYPLHVLVRYECEKLLMSGEVKAADIPALWNDLMKRHLGVEVPNDTVGCLQDMHWASNFVGYFTSYALGNAYAAQFVHHARQAYDGDVDAAIASGDVTPITGWLKENVWQHGGSLDPQDRITAACGEPFDPTYYTRYLGEKYGELYGLNG